MVTSRKNLQDVTITKSSMASWIIFIATLSFGILTTVAAIFPSLYLRFFGGREDLLGVNPFELGVWTLPVIVANVITFGIIFLYYKDGLPSLVTKAIKYFYNFETSQQLTILILVIVIGIYIITSVEELFDGYFQPDYYERVNDWLETFDAGQPAQVGFGKYLYLLFGVLSIQLFDNVQVIPFLSSIGLIIVTYFLTKELSGKRFCGIIASLVLLQSGVFLHYDTGITYPNFWIMFYLLSLLLMIKLWHTAPIFWIFGILTKLLTIIFLPMTIMFLYRTNVSKRKKQQILIIYAVIVVVGIIVFFVSEDPFTESIKSFEFDSHDFWGGISSIPYSLRYDSMVLPFLLPLVVALFIKSRNGTLQADSVNFLIFGMLFFSAMVPAMSDAINVPYRFVPLVVFFAIGCGIVLSKRNTSKIDTKL